MSTAFPPRIRIIVPSFNAAEFLRATIPALLASQNLEYFDIVVVENGSSNLESLFSPIDSKVSFECCPTFASAAAARNWGAQSSDASIFVFVDADVLVSPTTIVNLIQPLLNGSADACVGNYSRDIDKLTFAQAYKQTYVSHTYSRRAGPIYGEFWSAIGAVRADVFRQIGGFDETLRGAGGEDTELGRQLTQHGYRIESVAQASGVHLHKFTLIGVVRNDFRKGALTVRNMLHRKGSFANNRHSTRRDVLAVFLSVSLLFALLGEMMPSVQFSFMPAVSVCALLYLGARFDLLRCYFSHGFGFGFRALAFAYILDLVRAVAVVWGTLRFIFSSEIAPPRAQAARYS